MGPASPIVIPSNPPGFLARRYGIRRLVDRRKALDDADKSFLVTNTAPYCRRRSRASAASYSPSCATLPPTTRRAAPSTARCCTATSRTTARPRPPARRSAPTAIPCCAASERYARTSASSSTAPLATPTCSWACRWPSSNQRPRLLHTAGVGRKKAKAPVS